MLSVPLTLKRRNELIIVYHNCDAPVKFVSKKVYRDLTRTERQLRCTQIRSCRLNFFCNMSKQVTFYLHHLSHSPHTPLTERAAQAAISVCTLCAGEKQIAVISGNFSTMVTDVGDRSSVSRRPLGTLSASTVSCRRRASRARRVAAASRPRPAAVVRPGDRRPLRRRLSRCRPAAAAICRSDKARPGRWRVVRPSTPSAPSNSIYYNSLGVTVPVPFSVRQLAQVAPLTLTPRPQRYSRGEPATRRPVNRRNPGQTPVGSVTRQ